MNKSMR